MWEQKLKIITELDTYNIYHMNFGDMTKDLCYKHCILVELSQIILIST